MEEYEDDDSSDEEVDFEEATENAHVTFNLSKQKRQVSWHQKCDLFNSTWITIVNIVKETAFKKKVEHRFTSLIFYFHGKEQK